MKIIAHIGSSNVLVEMTRSEVAQITGKYGESELAKPSTIYGKDDGFRIGTEYGVSDIFHRLKHQETVRSQLQIARNNLIAIAGLMATVEPIADELTKQPTT